MSSLPVKLYAISEFRKNKLIARLLLLKPPLFVATGILVEPGLTARSETSSCRGTFYVFTRGEMSRSAVKQFLFISPRDRVKPVVTHPLDHSETTRLQEILD